MITSYVGLMIGFLTAIMLMLILLFASTVKYKKDFEKIQRQTAAKLEELETKVLKHRKVLKKVYRSIKKSEVQE